MVSHFQAQGIREVRFKRQAKRVFERSTIIGQRGSKYTVLGVAVLEPTLEFPDVSFSLSLSNGKDYVFSQIRPDEYERLIQTLQDWQQLWLGVRDQVSETSRLCHERREQWDAQQAQLEEQMAQVRMMQASMPTQEFGPPAP